MKVFKGAEDLDLTAEQRKACKMIIRGAATSAGGIGFIPIPGADMGPITAVQAGMIIALARVFGLTISQAVAKQAALGFIVGNTGRLIAGSLSKIIPVMGSVIGGGVACKRTEDLGWKTVDDFLEKKKKKEAAKIK